MNDSIAISLHSQGRTIDIQVKDLTSFQTLDIKMEEGNQVVIFLNNPAQLRSVARQLTQAAANLNELAGPPMHVVPTFGAKWR